MTYNKMTFKSFLKLTEIQTKVASVIPFLLGTLYVLFAFDTFNWQNALLFFAGMLIFDMTTTAINNYIDYAKAIKKEGYGYESHNAIVRDRLNPKTVRITIYGMLLVATVLGLLLFLRTDIIVLLLGMICFFIGVVYSFGPIPISRTPFGEIFSGVTMGFLIPFIAIYIHVFEKGIIHLSFLETNFMVSFDLPVLIAIFIVTIPLIAGIANIMLANNICDMEDDIINKRYTLPIYVGKQAALKVFATLYYCGYIAILVGVILKIVPWTVLITLMTLKPLLAHLKLFKAKQSKAETFILAVKNFVMVNVVYIISLAVGIGLNNIINS